MNASLHTLVFVVGALLALTVVYTVGFRRGRERVADDVYSWKWHAGPDGEQLAEGPDGVKLISYASGRWVIVGRSTFVGVAGGEEKEPIRAQIRAMRVYRALTETITWQGEVPR